MGNNTDKKNVTDNKKSGQVAKPSTAPANSGDLLDALDNCPLPQDSPKPGQPGFHWGM